MRFTTSPEQLKFFRTFRYLIVENVLSAQESSSLLSSINGVHAKSPGYAQEYLFRSIPFITSLIKRRGWGQIASELLQKKTVRLSYDRFFSTPPEFTHALESDTCALMIELQTQKGIFFTQFPTEKALFAADSNSYFLLVFTTRYLPENLHPVIHQ